MTLGNSCSWQIAYRKSRSYLFDTHLACELNFAWVLPDKIPARIPGGAFFLCCPDNWERPFSVFSNFAHFARAKLQKHWDKTEKRVKNGNDSLWNCEFFRLYADIIITCRFRNTTLPRVEALPGQVSNSNYVWHEPIRGTQLLLCLNLEESLSRPP